jgi:hypothetical protein
MEYQTNPGLYTTAEINQNFPLLPLRQMSVNPEHIKPPSQQGQSQNHTIDRSQTHSNPILPLTAPAKTQEAANEYPTDSGNQWQQVPNHKKRNWHSDDTNPPKKQNYWLGETPILNNRFSPLAQDNDMDGEPTPTEPKPPPIIITGVKIIKPLLELLDSIAKDKYTLKTLYNSQVKVQPLESTAYTTIIKALIDRHTEFHSYKPKNERSFRVVLRNIHPSTDTNDIKQSLHEIGHDANNVWNIKQRGTKIPLPIFFVDLMPKTNNKDIYGIDLLMHTKVKFEAPYVKREIPQCKRCQKFGHTKNFCRNAPKCVKCAAEHLTDQCPRTVNDSNVLCANCQEHHPANYRGCIVHKQLQQKYYPTPRERILPNTTRQPEISYAQATQRPTHTSPARESTYISPTPPQSNDDLAELKQMMKTIMNQMGTLINLMTVIITNNNNKNK